MNYSDDDKTEYKYSEVEMEETHLLGKGVSPKHNGYIAYNYHYPTNIEGWGLGRKVTTSETLVSPLPINYSSLQSMIPTQWGYGAYGSALVTTFGARNVFVRLSAMFTRIKNRIKNFI